MIFIIVAVFYWNYTHNIKIKGIYRYIRSIIKIFPSIVFLYPLIGHAGLKLHEYAYGGLYWFDLLMFFLDLAFYILFPLLEYYLTPVIAGSPLCGRAHMPSRILPDFGFSQFVQQDYISLFILVTSQNQFIKQFYCVFQILISIRRIFILSKNPFYSSAQTTVAISISVSAIVIQIGYLLSHSYPIFDNLLNVLVLSFLIFIVACILVELIQNYFNHKLKLAIEKNNFDYLKKANPQKIIINYWKRPWK